MPPRCWPPRWRWRRSRRCWRSAGCGAPIPPTCSEGGAAVLVDRLCQSPAAARLRPVPLAWRNLTANKRRLLRSSAGIGFAVLLMLMQLGFEQAFFDSSLQVIRGLDGDLFLQSAHKYQFATQDPFPAGALDTAARMPGIATRAAALCRLVRPVLEKPVRRQGVPGPRLGFRPRRAGLFVRRC